MDQMSALDTFLNPNPRTEFPFNIFLIILNRKIFVKKNSYIRKLSYIFTELFDLGIKNFHSKKGF